MYNAKYYDILEEGVEKGRNEVLVAASKALCKSYVNSGCDELTILSNLVHDLGITEEQASEYYQAYLESTFDWDND